MKLTIKNKEYTLKFGLDFIAHLDEKHFIMQNGFRFGQGITYAVAQIHLGNPLILLDLILAGTSTEKKPKVEDVKRFLETEVNIEALMNEFLRVLETTPATKVGMQKLGLIDQAGES